MAKGDTGLVRLTGLWKETTQEGDEYLSGRISPSSRLLVFVNLRRKAGDPEYVAYIGPAGDRAEEMAGQLSLWESQEEHG